MLKLTCHCGQIRIDLASRPDFINACNCTLCRKVGARWGYFHPAQVGVAGETRRYCRADKAEPAAELHFCGHCGATTHWMLTPAAIAKHGNSMMGVNMGLADEKDLAGIEQRYPDGLAWSGDGGFGYTRAPRILGAADATD